MTDKEKILAFLEGMSKGCCPKETKEIIINKIIPWINDLPKEPVSEDLDSFAIKYAQDKPYPVTVCQAVKVGAKWQKEQFEKNRLAACDKQTEEEAEIERDFVMGIIEKEHRQPTFDDAIKCGMRLQKEQIKEALLSEVLPYFMHGGEADEVVAKLDEVLNKKK